MLCPLIGWGLFVLLFFDSYFSHELTWQVVGIIGLLRCVALCRFGVGSVKQQGAQACEHAFPNLCLSRLPTKARASRSMFAAAADHQARPHPRSIDARIVGQRCRTTTPLALTAVLWNGMLMADRFRASLAEQDRGGGGLHCKYLGCSPCNSMTRGAIGVYKIIARNA